MGEVSGSGVALLRAVTAGRPRQVRLLLDAGAPVNQGDECSQTPLIKAIFIENPRSRLKIVQLLLRYGGTVSRSDVVGRNALAWACYYGREKVVEMCIKHRDVDLDLNMSDINGCTPLFHAATSGSAACVKNVIDILCKYAMNVDVPNFNGITPLMQSLRLGHDVSANILLHQGKASTTIRDSNFLSAGDWADRVRGTTHKNIGTGFLPEIFAFQHQQNKARPVKSRKSTGRSRGMMSGSVSNTDDDEDDDSTYGSDNSWAEILAETDSSYSSKSGDSSSHLSPKSPTITLGRTPINSPIPKSNGYQSGDEDFEFAVPAVDRPRPGNKPDRSQIKKNNNLPELYTMFSNQLSKTYRPGCRTLRSGTPAADSDHDVDCALECCNGRNLSPISSKSLPTIRLPEERIQGLVAANRLDRKSSSADTTGKRSKSVSLRKQLARKHLASSLQHVQEANGVPPADADDDNIPANDSTKTSLPNLPEGRTSLVSNASSFIRSTRTQEVERMLSGTFRM